MLRKAEELLNVPSLFFRPLKAEVLAAEYFLSCFEVKRRRSRMLKKQIKMIKNNRAMKVKLLALKMLMCCVAVGIIFI